VFEFVALVLQLTKEQISEEVWNTLNSGQVVPGYGVYAAGLAWE
jgi:hypothetical protein